MGRITLKSATNGLKRAGNTSIHAPLQKKVLPRNCFYGWREDHSLQAFAKQTWPGPGAPGNFHSLISARPQRAGLLRLCTKAASRASFDLALSIAAQTAFKRWQDEWHRGTASQELYVGAHPSFLGRKTCHTHQESQPSPAFTYLQSSNEVSCHPPRDDDYSVFGQTLPNCHSMLL